MITVLKLRPYTGDMAASSPNHSERRAPVIEGIVLHATEDGGNEARSLAWMRSRKSQVSCHLWVSRAGRVTRLVGDQQRAWHAGQSWWRGTSDVNSITLGIEIANRNDGEPYTDAQYRRVAEIVAYYCRQGLSLDDVVSHQAIAAGRKTDPFGWDWERFRGLVREQLRPAANPAATATTPADAAQGILSRLPALVARVSGPPEQQIPARTASPLRQPGRIGLPKPLLRSRTLWLNALTVLAAAAALLGDAADLAHRVGITLVHDLTAWALFCVGAMNIVLRLLTKQPLGIGIRLKRPPVSS